MAKIREAKARLEERARVRTEEVLLAKGVDADVAKAAGQSAEPRDKEQSNFTDPDSRIMKTKAGWVQGYNAQVMVEASSGVIVAEEVGNHSADSPRLIPMLDATEANLKAIGVSIQPNSDQPNSNGKSSVLAAKVFSADAGYCSEEGWTHRPAENLTELENRRIDAYVATGREKHHQGWNSRSIRGGVDPKGKPRTPKRVAMRAKLQTDEGRAIYARRKCITEPVHGLIKQARGFRQFLLRGLEKVQAEFALVALTHNLLKLWRAKVVGSAA